MKSMLAQQVDTLQRKVTDLAAQLQQAQELLAAKSADLTTARKTAEQLHDESTEELERSIRDIDTINAKVRDNLNREKAEEDARGYRIVDPHWVEGRDIAEPKEWHPAQQLITYLETLFDSTETVGYVTRSFEKDGKYMPTKGDWSRTAGRLIEALSHCKNDVGAVLGDYNPAVGAWIRFNPLDGKGVRNDNVTEFRYALVECDGMELERQNALIRELELPVACLVHSGGKSLHAIVHIDAADYNEYRSRVEYLYAVCRRNGLELDQQNRNPSRLSRMPGVMRNGKKQFLVDTNIGKANFAEWQEWIESVTDDLPDPESMADVWGNLPDLAPPLIEGVLRQGHKMLLAGPSKAGKSFGLIELVIALAEGRDWLGFSCAQGRVLYVNLELDRASCLHRFRDVYDKLGWPPRHLSNIDIWNLRGKAIPMDKLAPTSRLRRTSKTHRRCLICWGRGRDEKHHRAHGRREHRREHRTLSTIHAAAV